VDILIREEFKHKMSSNNAIFTNQIINGNKKRIIYEQSVNTHLYNISDKDEGYYLLVSRLVTYKRIDLAVEALSKLGLPLVIVGDGLERNELENIIVPARLLYSMKKRILGLLLWNVRHPEDLLKHMVEEEL